MLDCDLRVGLAISHIDRAAEYVEGALNRKLTIDSDLGRGGVFYVYEADPRPADGLTYVRVCQNFVEGNGWVYDTNERLRILLEIFVRAPHVFDLGGWLAELERHCPFDVVPFAYVVRPERKTAAGKAEFLYAYGVDFDAEGRPAPPAPSLQCTAVFALEGGDFEGVVADVATRVGGLVERDRQAQPVQLVSSAYGRMVLGRQRGARSGEALRLTAQWTTSSVLELGRLWKRLDGVTQKVSPVSHDIEGDLLRDGVPRRLSYRPRG